MAPIGGGRVSVDGTTVLVISPSAPLGEAMVELETDDTFDVDSPRGLLHYTITAIW